MAAVIVSDHEFGNGDLWVFGYGSLMWRPGFEYLEKVPARLIGEHRALCVYSFDHRGTPEKPGLVLGLDRGGACRGVAFRVAPELREATVEYLDGDFRVLSPGSYVRCAVTGEHIPLDELKYWSVERQEAYAGPQAVMQRLGSIAKRS